MTQKTLSPENQAHRQRQALCALHSPQWRKQVRAVRRMALAQVPQRGVSPKPKAVP